ncbi:hypothetical protein B5S32_g4381 [[Candida] boidinii]|nr:hypothetical protein B5S32_g4381 [[Candida] boidinii]
MSVSRIDKYIENYNFKNNQGEIVNRNHTYYHINCPHCPQTVLSKKDYRRFLNYELTGSISRSLYSHSNTECSNTHPHHPSNHLDISRQKKKSIESVHKNNEKIPSTGNSWETIPDGSHDEITSASVLCEHEECFHSNKTYEIDSNGIKTYTYYFPFCKYQIHLSPSSSSSSSSSSFSSVASYYSASSRFKPLCSAYNTDSLRSVSFNSPTLNPSNAKSSTSDHSASSDNLSSIQIKTTGLNIRMDFENSIDLELYPEFKNSWPREVSETSSDGYAFESFSESDELYGFERRIVTTEEGEAKIEYFLSPEVDANANRQIELWIKEMADEAVFIRSTFPSLIKPPILTDETPDFFDRDVSAPFTDYDLSYDSNLGMCIHRNSIPIKRVTSHSPSAFDLSFFAELLEEYESEDESHGNQEIEVELSSPEPQSNLEISSNVVNPIVKPNNTQIQSSDSSVNSFLDLTYDPVSEMNSEIDSVTGIFSSSRTPSLTEALRSSGAGVNDSYSNTQSYVPQSEIITDESTSHCDHTENSFKLPPMTSRVINGTQGCGMVSNSKILQELYTQFQKDKKFSDNNSDNNNESNDIYHISETNDSFGDANNNVPSSIHSSNDNITKEDRENIIETDLNNPGIHVNNLNF